MEIFYTMKILLPILTMVICCIGCAHSHFTAVTQENGGYVREDAILPIYLSPPSVPYTVIGEINVETSRLRNPDKVASQEAIAKGANALILENEGTINKGAVGTTVGNAEQFGNLTVYNSTHIVTPVRRKVGNYLAIRITDTDEDTNATDSTPKPSWYIKATEPAR